MSLQFISVNKLFKFNLSRKIYKWLADSVIKKNFIIGDINIIFCNDKYLLNLNINYLSHKTLTDIITFDYSYENVISGDLYISINRIKSNAEKFHVTFEKELNRVMIHGILHLMGYKDELKSERNLMNFQENIHLKKLNKI
jgi:rRNA maturation RNase YbeY